MTPPKSTKLATVINTKAQQLFNSLTPQEYMLHPELHQLFVEANAQECYKGHSDG